MTRAKPSASQKDPAAEYAARLESLRASRRELDRRHRTLGWVSLALAALIVLAVAGALGWRWISAWWVLVPGVGIVISETLHGRVMRRRKHRDRSVAYYDRALARIENRWMGGGETGAQFLDSAHPYARDLDLFGKGSLFELLSTARTRAGEEALARWLLAAAPVEEIGRRHAAVNDLRLRLGLREDLAVHGEDVRSQVRPEALAAWAEADPILKRGAARSIAFVLAGAWLLSIAAWFGWGWWEAALLSSAVNLFFYWRFRERLQQIAPDAGVRATPGAARPARPSAEAVAPDLAVLAVVLERMERENFSAAKLAELQAALKSGGMLASRAIARLGRLVDYLEQRRSMVVAALDPFVFWTLQFSFAIEAWRANFGAAIRGWLSSLGEMEALCALAGYAYEHPEDVFPEFASPEDAWFQAEGLGHPLIAETQAVRNDVTMGRELRLLIISGPNMAGKSTLVRAVGVNAVLAQCGAPVRARRLRLSPLAVAASICVLDSLQGGVSRFYAEITRLRLISEMTAGPVPVMFLLDELLSGTNSHDRRIGAEGLARNLVEHGAIGMITTHDLALARMAEQPGARAANFHFSDRLENGRLRFDYKLSPGVVQTSNALGLMRSIGLDV